MQTGIFGTAPGLADKCGLREYHPSRWSPRMTSTLLKGRGILITGGSIGFGRVLALACMDAGADVMVSARGPEKLEEVRLELCARAGGGQVVVGNSASVSNEREVRDLVGSAQKLLPRFGIFRIPRHAKGARDFWFLRYSKGDLETGAWR
jgi:hypothetical protein